MKNLLLFLLLTLYVSSHINAQAIAKKPKVNKVWVNLNEEPFYIEGALYQATDTSIIISESYNTFDYSMGYYRGPIHTFEANKIDIIKTRAVNSSQRGVLLGALAGLVVGVLVGSIGGDASPKNAGTSTYMGFISVTTRADGGSGNGLLTGLGFGVLGMGVGALLSSTKIKIPINGKMENYKKRRMQLWEYAIKKY